MRMILVQADCMSDSVCQRLSDLIAENIGLNFPPERYPDLQRGMVSAATEFGFADSSRCAHWLLSTPLTRQQLNALASHLTIGETYFFRDRKFFDVLARQILPDLLHHRRRLRLWSAACCTGEEAYSLAILIDQWGGHSPECPATILATDINERFLQKAAAGVYGEWSFRDAPPGLKERYFTRTADGRFAVNPQIKRHVRFEHMNLTREVGALLGTENGAMDLILCRNVLMYFTPAHARQLVERLHGALADGGWLVVAPSECSQTLFSRFATVSLQGALIYRKQQPGAEVTPEAPLAVFEAPPQENNYSKPLNPRAELPHPYEVAMRLYREGQYTEATDILLGWLRESPPAPAPTTAPTAWHPGLLSLLTRALANQGRLTEALEWSEHWIAADKIDPAAHYLRAIVLQETGAYEAARRCLQRATYLQPDFALAHFALANLAQRESRRAEANKHFENAAYVLRACAPEETLPESDGLTARGLLEIITEATCNDKRQP